MVKKESRDGQMKFIHAADLHLDSPLRGLENYDEAPAGEIRTAPREAFKNLVQLAIDEGVAFVLLAGDLYDRDQRDFRTALFLSGQLSRLNEAGIKVFMIAGNHDAASVITKGLEMPGNVKRLSVEEPETVQVELGNHKVAVHGQGYPVEAVTDNIAREYPQGLSGHFNVGLLHTSLEGREGHEHYAPCKLNHLLSKDYSYWALGHVHKREVVNEDPWVLFPGNIQGRSVRETGPKGCTLVTVEDYEIVSVEHRDLDVMRWCVCEVDVSGMENPLEVRERVADPLREELEKSEGRLLAVRVRLTGSCGAHRELKAHEDRWESEIRSRATEESPGMIWIEKVIIDTENEKERADLDEIVKRDDPVGYIVRAVLDLGGSSDLLDSMIDEFSGLDSKLPVDIKSGEEPLDLKSQEVYGELMEDVKQKLLDRILSEGGDE